MNTFKNTFIAILLLVGLTSSATLQAGRKCPVPKKLRDTIQARIANENGTKKQPRKRNTRSALTTAAKVAAVTAVLAVLVTVVHAEDSSDICQAGSMRELVAASRDISLETYNSFYNFYQNMCNTSNDTIKEAIQEANKLCKESGTIFLISYLRTTCPRLYGENVFALLRKCVNAESIEKCVGEVITQLVEHINR